jgi:competence protein ComFB
MRVHNLVEDLVIQKVKEMFAGAKDLQDAGICISEQCQMDVVCFVLNRIPPEYATSGRGVAYSENDYKKKIQRLADITALIKEGMQTISARQRPVGGEMDSLDPGYYFNVPSVIGRLFNGANFAPISDVSVALKLNGELVKVLDPNWQNPYSMVKNTAGTFLFWPHPIPSEENKITKTFEFEIEVKAPGYEELHYFFEQESTSGDHFMDFVMTTESYRLRDLYLFPLSEE